MANSLKEAGRSLWAQDAGRAVKHMKAVLDTSPDDPRNHLLYANALSDAGQFEAADEHFTKAIEGKPKAAAPACFKALSLLDRGDNAQALEAAEKVLLKNPKHELACMVRGLALLASGDSTEAAIAIDNVGEPDNLAFASRLLLILESQPGMEKPFHPVFDDKYLTNVPDLPKPNDRPQQAPDGWWSQFLLRRKFNHGIALRQRLQFGKSLQKFFEVLAVLPTDPDVLMEAAETYYLLGRFDDALALLDRMQLENGQTVIAGELRGLVLYAMGRVEDAKPLILDAASEDVEVKATDEPVDLASYSMTCYYAGRIALSGGDKLAARSQFAKIPPIDPALINDRWEEWKENH